MDKNKVCFVKPRMLKGDYLYEGIRRLGYLAIIPYKDTNLFRRLIREFWFRLHLPFRSIFFNKKLKKVEADVFIVSESLTCKQFLYWLKKHHPNSRVCLNFENRAALIFDPNLVDSNLIEKWSYDKDDCRKYGMKYIHSVFVNAFEIDAREKNEILYDIFFLGRDKNRGPRLASYNEKFKELGLTLYSYICADRAFLQFKNKNYKPLLKYEEYLKLLKNTKAILNIMPEGQTSVTQRELETAFFNIKCVTTNKGILQSDLYDKSRYFVLDVDDYSTLKDFLNSPIKPVDKKILDKYSLAELVREFVDDDPGELD